MALYKRKDKIYVYKREFFDNDVDFKLLFVNEYYGLTARQLSDRVSLLQRVLQKDSIFVYWVLSHPLDQDTKDHRSPSGVDDQFVLPF
ncbi:hypothetical protein [Butyricimonas paravirosa]|jgi:outer membrane scaffolding protein for murein synthesis (MipA/OmpV family)|uniref:hypothetical protein n=1 Tax=Butyricimonas paravirosa TaxID=1472417 RepID=UPI0035208647